tara:strand:- start:2792 stop:2938 length:147 start_codon:yes stop_codon:yes gene_type:complete
MKLSKEEILLILEEIRKNHGPGYAKEEKVSRLQAKLSIMLEAEERYNA